MQKILDITFPVHPGMTVWPGDTPTAVEAIKEIENGARSTVSRLELSSHAGTHLDAPAHFIEGGKTVESLDLAVLIGPCIVVEVDDADITAGVIDALDLPRDATRVLFKTRNSARFSGTEPFFTDYTGVSVCGAERLKDLGVRLVGIDSLSVAAYNDIAAVHHTLLGAEIILLETLNLRDVSPGKYQLICLPLKLDGVDGSPCRAVLLPDSP